MIYILVVQPIKCLICIFNVYKILHRKKQYDERRKNMTKKIYEKKYSNMDAIIMENDNIKLTLLPEIGFKIASMVYKPKEKEIFFQPTNNLYKIPSYGDTFEIYDTSGCDDMIPTIDKCSYPIGKYKNTILSDHGESWSTSWNAEIKNDKIIGSFDLKSLPLTFKKVIYFKDDNSINMDYTVKNNDDENIIFIWALHGLNAFDENTEILIPKENDRIINVHSSELLGDIGDTHSFPILKEKNIDLTKLNSYEDKKTYKYYFLEPFKTGTVGLNYKDDNLTYLIHFEPEKIPYVGIWITTGGFKGEYNVAIEPTNGFYDSLKIAYENNKFQTVNRNSEKSWSISLELLENR